MRHDLFALYASTRGNYFFQEIRRLLADGLRAHGAAAVECDEGKGFLPGARWHVVCGPQEFFYLGKGEGLRTGPWPPGVVLYNAEPPDSEWFFMVRRLLPRAHAVWEMDRGASRRLAGEGWRCAHLPLGWVPGCALFDAVPELPALPALRALPPEARPFRADRTGWRRRPLDFLFAGSRVPRREAFFSSAEPRLSRFRGFVRMVDDSRFLRAGKRAGLTSRAFLGLAQRSKIVLNIRRQERRYFEWHRIALHGIAQGALVVSEPAGAGPLLAGRDFVAAALEDIPEAVRYYLSSARGRAEAERIAARGGETYRTACAAGLFLPAALAALAAPRPPAAARALRREQAALSLLRR